MDNGYETVLKNHLSFNDFSRKKLSSLQTYYVDFERPNITYINRKYYDFLNVSALRYSRRDPIHYVNVHVKTCAVFGNDIQVDGYVHEFLSNEYRPSIVEIHFRLCEGFAPTKYHMLMPFYLKYFHNASMCPFQKGEYHFLNVSIPNLPVLKTFPFRKGRLICKFTRRKERVMDGYVDAVIKHRYL